MKFKTKFCTVWLKKVSSGRKFVRAVRYTLPAQNAREPDRCGLLWANCGLGGCAQTYLISTKGVKIFRPGFSVAETASRKR